MSLNKNLPALFLWLFFTLLFSNSLCAQNETSKWFFGATTAIDFMPANPTPINGSAMNAYEGSSSVADAAGNLLFYTNGNIVWNRLHQVMANGTNLALNNGVTQGTLILKKPGSQNLYYLFTIDEGLPTYTYALRYSIIDMNLAAGNGSVTIKNATLLAAPVTEKITGTHHCNGTDIWVVIHELGNNVFKSFLLTATGISTTIVTSATGTNHPGERGQMKISAPGNKLGITVYQSPGNTIPGGFELLDFDNSTGVVSNPINLATNFFVPWGLEFSPDGSKLYGTAASPASFSQWDLCAGSPSAIVSSMFTYTNSNARYDLQLAPNGKIYAQGAASHSALTVVNAPNQPGLSANVVPFALSLAPKTCSTGLPNFIASMVKTPFTYTEGITCLTASFSSASHTVSAPGCNAAGPLVTSVWWNFGDPASGSANTSTLMDPVHVYPVLGDYTVTLVRFTGCGSDTIRRLVRMNGPAVSFSCDTITCNGLSSATVAVQNSFGPYTYTWMPGGNTTTVAGSLTPGPYSVTIQGNPAGCVKTVTVNVPTPSLVTITTSFSSSYFCNYNLTTINASGGSGNYAYLWSPGSVPTKTIGTSPTGIYTVNVTDNVFHCTATKTVQINYYATPTLALSGNTLICQGQTATLTALGAHTYSWLTYVIITPTSSSSSPPYLYTPNIVVTPSSTALYYLLEGKNTYTAPATPSGTLNYSCRQQQTITIKVAPSPTINVNVTPTIVCNGEQALLTVVGADLYNWQGSSTANSLNVSPSASTVYTVIGTYSVSPNCSSSKTAQLKVDECLDVIHLLAKNSGLHTYPNPCDDSFTIEINKGTSLPGETSLVISDLTGRVLITARISENNPSIHVSSLGFASGIYYVSLSAGGQKLATTKMIVQH